MVDNFMYDVDHGEEFLIGDNPAQYHSYWWNDGEPLWITATKQVHGRGQELRLGKGVVRSSCWGLSMRASYKGVWYTYYIIRL